MSVVVVDASVVVKWFVPEVHSNAARLLLTAPHDFLAPDLLFAETANTIWKKVRRGELTPTTGAALVEDIGRVAVDTIPCRVLAADAYALANETKITAYDAMYVALAVRLDAALLTTDERLASAVAAIPPLASCVRIIRD